MSVSVVQIAMQLCFLFWLKSSSFQTLHQTSILVKKKGAIAYLRKSNVCKGSWDFALAKDGSAAKKRNKDFPELQKTTEMHGQENKQAFFLVL